ncbi:MAG: helix-turn-helix domain-containing protein [Fimbriiglobus sp.]|jgi:DNA-binding XRE family transcriptional regulator|nr:helix-turn-helix domain-containing protein [Fimbriiglobus sp.]
MSEPRTHRDMNWTPEQRAKHKATREKFQRERPTPQELLDSGEYAGPIPHGVYLAFRRAMHDLKAAREAAGLSLADVAERSGIDKAALSRLETGVTENPTLETLMRYAAAVGKQLTFGLSDLPAAA